VLGSCCVDCTLLVSPSSAAHWWYSCLAVQLLLPVVAEVTSCPEELPGSGRAVSVLSCVAVSVA
jgi:hypothetical protein